MRLLAVLGSSHKNNAVRFINLVEEPHTFLCLCGPVPSRFVPGHDFSGAT
jgi:hypothetical protein